MQLPGRVHLCDVSLRDGLQMERSIVETETKVAWCHEMARAGIREIEVTSFVSPKAVPQLADAEEVVRRIERTSGVRYSAVVANLKGAERAILSGIDCLNLVVSATNSHSLANTKVTTAEAMERAGEIIRRAREAGIAVAGGIATALGCPFEGVPPYGRIEALCARYVEEYGLTEVLIADTVGLGTPRLVFQTMTALGLRFPGVTWRLHIHDTRRMGMANLMAGLQAGVIHFDTSLAGLGGCPFVPGATGNIATEDVVHMLHGMDIRTGIDLDRLLDLGRTVAAQLGHHESSMLRAGPGSRLSGLAHPSGTGKGGPEA